MENLSEIPFGDPLQERIDRKIKAFIAETKAYEEDYDWEQAEEAKASRDQAHMEMAHRKIEPPTMEEVQRRRLEVAALVTEAEATPEAEPETKRETKADRDPERRAELKAGRKAEPRRNPDSKGQ